MSATDNRIYYNGRRFRAIETSANGEVSGGTIFSYRQRGDIAWATYEGGGVAFGTLIATADEAGALDMRYSHVNDGGDLRTGVCRSTPELLTDGRLRLHERWRWTCCDDESEGTSVLEEVTA